MPYHLKVKENAGAGLKRILLEEIEEARSRLVDDIEGDPTEAIHDARKRLKKCRAVMKLVRSDIGRRDYKALNRSFRDTGRLLSPVRDADVLITTLDGLIEDKRRLVATRSVLRERRRTTREQILGDKGVVDEARARVDDLERSVRSLTFNSAGSALFLSGLKDAYAGGRKAYSLCLDDPTDENLHEWRKRSKDVWYHVRILKPVWPETIDGLANEAHRLSDLLGDDHDLAVLADTLLSDGSLKADQVNEIVGLIDERRPRLQAEAFKLGARLFAEKPGQYARRLGAYWDALEADPSTTASSVDADLVAADRG